MTVGSGEEGTVKVKRIIHEKSNDTEEAMPYAAVTWWNFSLKLMCNGTAMPWQHVTWPVSWNFLTFHCWQVSRKVEQLPTSAMVVTIAGLINIRVSRCKTTSWNWFHSVPLCYARHSQNGAISPTRLIASIQSKMANKNNIWRRVSMFLNKFQLLMSHSAMPT